MGNQKPRVAVPSSAAREQLELVKESIETFDQQIKITSEMIAGLALLRDATRLLAGALVEKMAVLRNREEGDPGDIVVGESWVRVCEGASVVLTNWGRRLTLDKNQLVTNKAYNENLIRMAESGLIIPR